MHFAGLKAVGESVAEPLLYYQVNVQGTLNLVQAMLQQGSGGAYEVSTRFTAMVGWGAVNGVDDFVWDGASQKYALDDAVSEQLRRSNPEAYRNVLARLLEAAGRGMWNADEDVLRRLREKYADADDSVEGVA